MPELPEMEAWRRELDEPVSAFPIEKAGPAHIATLKTFDPPLAALEGRRLSGADRRAKRLLFPTEDGELVLLVHLMTAGRLRYVTFGEKRPKTPAFRLQFQGGAFVRCHAADEFAIPFLAKRHFAGLRIEPGNPGLGFLHAVAAGRRILRNAYRGVESLTRLALRMREHDYAAEPRYRPSGELGEVMDAFLAMRDTVRDSEAELTAQLERNERNRAELLLRLALTLGMVAIVSSTPFATQLSEPEMRVVSGVFFLLLVTTSLSSSVWWLQLDRLQSAFCFRLGFVRPVSTARLVAVPMVYSMLASVASYVLPAWLFGILRKVPMPIWGPTPYIACAVAASFG